MNIGFHYEEIVTYLFYATVLYQAKRVSAYLSDVSGTTAAVFSCSVCSSGCDLGFSYME